MTDVTYRPLDTPKPVADDVWIVDSGPHWLAGMPLPVRMTVLRLSNGGLVLHSPTRFTPDLKQALEALGAVAHLVAPNTAHWSYMVDWQKRYPSVASWAAPGLSRRPAVSASGLRIDHDLAGGAPQAWRDEIECIVVRGTGLTEVALFHRPSRTLVLTDLVVNVEPEKLPFPLAIGARLVGSTAPNGRAPIYARLAMRTGGDEAASAARRLVALKPDRVIFAHGKWFESNGGQRLREALSWLTR
ncbi:DUF4336 domain-containing protein [Devosia nitrariae]|uniref:DUF4336 domain-containing protein n=1 Tax=Devosia nitrariae TaxID=2071872 RepID=A0ABQ5W8U4_9HYPH|nr:DUF4336 domain-containing protein [Devosia nitrariae]GLQ56451.1 hypothetical protein GCM10010862_37100 [Devosia nitrariae]